MSSPVSWKIHIDGAARGNPGPAAYAFIIQREGAPALEEKGTLGTMTNNLAEYTALVRALERAGRLGGERLIIFSDSELLVKQMTGEYRVKNPDLRVLYDRAKELSGQFKQVVFRHVPREHNSGADRLCNEALDEAAGNERNLFARDRKSRSENDISSEIREKAINHLRSAAERWAKGNAASPSPEAVWDQLWRVLEDAGLVPPLEE
jgi:ribonuclease HI